MPLWWYRFWIWQFIHFLRTILLFPQVKSLFFTMKIFWKNQLFVRMKRSGLEMNNNYLEGWFLLCINNVWKSLKYLSKYPQFRVPSSEACSDCGKLYIWFHHCIWKDARWRLFDQKQKFVAQDELTWCLVKWLPFPFFSLNSIMV